MTKLTTKRQILAENNQFNNKTSPLVSVDAGRGEGGAKGGTESVYSFVTFLALMASDLLVTVWIFIQGV